MEKVLVLGNKGMLGHVLYETFQTNDFTEKYDVIGINRSDDNRDNKSYRLDVLNFIELEQFIKNKQPKYIVNCIGSLVEASLEDLIEDNATNDLTASGAQAIGDAYLLLADDGTDSALYLVVVKIAIADNGPIAANGANLIKLLTFDGTTAAEALVATNFEIVA